MPGAGGIWDMLNAGQQAQVQGTATAAAPAAPAPAWNPTIVNPTSASVLDVYKSAMQDYLRGAYQQGYDNLNLAVSKRPDEFKAFDAKTGNPQNTPSARLLARFKVALNMR